MEVTGNVSHLSKGQKIEQIRKLMGISQTELGKRLGISKQAVSKMERSEKISRNTLDRIAGHLCRCDRRFYTGENRVPHPQYV